MKIAKKIIVYVVIFAFLTSFTNSVQSLSPNGGPIYNGHEYLLITDTRIWAEAKADCESRGGHLVTISSAGENDFVSNLAGPDSIWIGFTDEENEGDWKWVTGEPVTYTNWAPDEPNDSSGEDYCELLDDGSWNDDGAPNNPSLAHFYVCERDAEGGRIIYNDHVYQLFTVETTWTDARDDCDARGGHLVTITSNDENNFVSNLAETNNIFIGFTDELNEGTWEWITGEPVTYTFWASGEPNDDGGEDHAEMLSDGMWNDLPFDNLRFYVCEWDAISGRVTYNDHEYQLFTDSKTWTDAKADCEARGGHLVTISSNEENDFVSGLTEPDTSVWIGFTDEENEGDWRWITGEPVTYTNWDSSEPNDAPPGEDHAELYSSGKWNDLPGDYGGYYVCEWDKSVIFLEDFEYSGTPMSMGWNLHDNGNPQVDVTVESTAAFGSSTGGLLMSSVIQNPSVNLHKDLNVAYEEGIAFDFWLRILEGRTTVRIGLRNSEDQELWLDYNHGGYGWEGGTNPPIFDAWNLDFNEEELWFHCVRYLDDDIQEALSIAGPYTSFVPVAITFMEIFQGEDGTSIAHIDDIRLSKGRIFEYENEYMPHKSDTTSSTTSGSDTSESSGFTFTTPGFEMLVLVSTVIVMAMIGRSSEKRRGD
ncbi:MAG: lectin-like protein [Candidatus Hodarchaeales archaeon]|jgi:hypothetical protein